MRSIVKRFFCGFLSATLLVTSVYVPTVQASVVGSEALLGQADVATERERVRDFLARDDVAKQMQTLGVSSGEARNRVDAMTDDEVLRAAGALDRMPAGQDVLGGVLGLVLIIFIILLLTDILGLTHVFPFTRRR